MFNVTVRSSVRPCDFCQHVQYRIFSITAFMHFWTQMNASYFGVKRSKFKITVEYLILEMALSGINFIILKVLCVLDTFSPNLYQYPLNNQSIIPPSSPFLPPFSSPLHLCPSPSPSFPSPPSHPAAKWLC